MNSKAALVRPDQIKQAIFLIRGQRVMLDRDLAALYGVETKNLNRAVRRNRDRFPADFMFQLTDEEAEVLRCQFVTSNAGRGGRRYLPYVFTQEGVAMLSSVLRSPRAAQVNIAIMRVLCDCGKRWPCTRTSPTNWGRSINNQPPTIKSQGSGHGFGLRANKPNPPANGSDASRNGMRTVVS